MTTRMFSLLQNAFKRLKAILMLCVPSLIYVLAWKQMVF